MMLTVQCAQPYFIPVLMFLITNKSQKIFTALTFKKKKPPLHALSFKWNATQVCKTSSTIESLLFHL